MRNRDSAKSGKMPQLSASAAPSIDCSAPFENKYLYQRWAWESGVVAPLFQKHVASICATKYVLHKRAWTNRWVDIHIEQLQGCFFEQGGFELVMALWGSAAHHDK